MTRSKLNAIVLTAFGSVLFALSFFVEDGKDTILLWYATGMFYLFAFAYYVFPGERDYSGKDNPYDKK